MDFLTTILDKKDVCHFISDEYEFVKRIVSELSLEKRIAPAYGIRLY